jgi:ABC-type transport system substrate-binding protein
VKNPGEYVVDASILAYSSLDPATNYETGGSGLNSLICETLYGYDNSSAIDLVPVLAAAPPTISADGKQYNITLKQGIMFTDGTEFNAYVYKYSIDRVMMISDPNSAAFILAAIKGGEDAVGYGDMNVTEANNYLSAGGIKVLSDYEIQFNLDYAFAPFIPAMTYQVGCAISPKFVIDHYNYGLSDFTPITPSHITTPSTLTAADNTTGMVSLNNWFPELAGD